MWIISALAVATFVTGLCAGPVVVSRGQSGSNLLGSKLCTQGPAYWCDNIRNAAGCETVSWCIDKSWSSLPVTQDNDDVCKICKQMVEEARTTLLSNMTQEEIREVLEGSCRLIPIKPIADECIELADEFEHELVTTLASELDPEVVCTVSGLCNNVSVDQMLQQEVSSSCHSCENLLEASITSLQERPVNDVMDSWLALCGRLGTFSDSCSEMLVMFYPLVYRAIIEGTIDKPAMCSSLHLCAVDIQVPDNFGTAPTPTCDFCIHMVKHWKDELESNTTRDEFKTVLEGLCGRTGQFVKECTEFVDTYYETLYDYLLDEIRANEICRAVGLCSADSLSETNIWPLVRSESDAAATLRQTVEGPVPMMKLTPAIEPPMLSLTPASLPKLHRVHLEKGRGPLRLRPGTLVGQDEHNANVYFDHSNEEGEENSVAEEEHDSSQQPEPNMEDDMMDEPNTLDNNMEQLPVERLMPEILLRRHSEPCVLCEYILHFLQNYLMDKETEAEIREDVEDICHRLPEALADQCADFVDEFGDAIIVMLAQEIDPSQVCPKLHICPSPPTEQASGAGGPEVEELGGEFSCALCEYAMNTLLTYLKNTTNDEIIADDLDKLCSYLPSTLSVDCQEFVNTFADDIISMIVSGMTADEICQTLELCTSASAGGVDSDLSSREEIETNEIPQLPPSRLMPQVVIQSEVQHLLGNPEEGDDQVEGAVCVMCEYAISEIKEILSDNATDEEIEDAVKYVCNYLPQTVAGECRQLVDQYGPLIIDVLKNADPDAACQEIGACPSSSGDSFVKSVQFDTCDTCELVVDYADRILADGGVEHYITSKAEALCNFLPASSRPECHEIIREYGPFILGELVRYGNKETICRDLTLCERNRGHVQLLGGDRCSWGPTYWCQSRAHATSCGALEHCQEMVWTSEDGEQL